MTESLYQVRVRDPVTGDLLAATGHWRSLVYERRVNAPGICSLVVHNDDSLVDDLDTDVILDIWRQYWGGSWYRDFTCLHRGLQRVTEPSGLKIITAHQRGLLDLLARRIVLGYAATPFTVKAGVAESVLKEFVTEQAVASGIVRVIAGLSVEADGAGGNAIAPEVPWRELLEVLQDYAGNIGGGDYDLDLDTDDAVTFTFAWYDGQRGTDRTWGSASPLVFSVDRGNVKRMTYNQSRLGEVTSVIVGGQGSEGVRPMRVVDNAAAIADSPWNRVETFLNMSNLTGNAELDDAGNAELEKNQYKETLEFELLQSGNAVYGEDFDLGDLVTVVDNGVQINKKIVRINVKVDRAGETVKVEATDVP